MSGRNRFFSAVHSSSRKKLHCQWKIKMKMNPKGSNDASLWTRSVNHKPVDNNSELECEPMPHVMVALTNIGGALGSTPQSLADAHY